MSLEVLKVKEVKKKIHPLDKTLNPALPQHPFLQLLVAPPRSGKTSLLLNLLFNNNFYNADDYWHEVWYISPTQLFDSTCCHYLPKLSNIIQIHDPEEIMNLEEILREIIKGQKKLHKEGEEMKRIYIILDDCVSYLKPISVLATKYRHHHLSISIVSQSFRSIPLIVRNCANSVIFFHLNNMRELEKIDDEYGSNYCSDFIELAKKYTEKKYNFIHLNNDKMIMYHNFSDIIKDCSAKD
jgi:hypothetical protein